PCQSDVGPNTALRDVSVVPRRRMRKRQTVMRRELGWSGPLARGKLASRRSLQHGCEWRQTARCPGPRLADRNARRREMPRSALRALARRAALHAPAQARRRRARHRAAARPRQLVSLLAEGGPLLPLSVAADAPCRALEAAAVRPGYQPEPLRRQVGRAAAGSAARVLLFHTDAVCLALARRLFRPAGPPGNQSSAARPAPG